MTIQKSFICLAIAGLFVFNTAQAESCIQKTPGGKITCTGVKCPSNQIKKNNQCISCPSNEIVSNNQCTACPSGKIANTGQTACIMSASTARAGCPMGEARKTSNGNCEKYQGVACTDDNKKCSVVWS